MENTAETGSDGSDSTDGGSTTDDTPAGDEAEATSKANSTESGNLFGDEETESSASDSPEKAKDTEAPKPVKKSSIFDQ